MPPVSLSGAASHDMEFSVSARHHHTTRILLHVRRLLLVAAASAACCSCCSAACCSISSSCSARRTFILHPVSCRRQNYIAELAISSSNQRTNFVTILAGLGDRDWSTSRFSRFYYCEIASTPKSRCIFALGRPRKVVT